MRYIIAVVSLSLGLLGCNWLTPLAFVLPEPKRTIEPEYAHLSGSVTVLVWAPLETIYDYRHARLEVAAYVATELSENIRKLKCTEVDLVEDYIRSSSQFAFDPVAVGKHFGTDRVIYLELLEFAFREFEAPDLLRGRIRASVVVYDISDPSVPAKRYELEPAQVVVPEDGPLIYNSTAAIGLRQMTYEEFAGVVAKKFYAHEEVVK